MDRDGIRISSGQKEWKRRAVELHMKEPARILHVLGGLSLGGAESRIMDLYRWIDREQVQFDFLVHQKETGERIPEFYDAEAETLGGRIYTLPKFRLYNILSYRQAVRAFFREHHAFRLVQGHMTSTASLYLPEARRAGIPMAVAHARSAGVDQGLKGQVTRLLRLPLLSQADYCFACSREAGMAVFGSRWSGHEKSWILPNAIDAGQFAYAPQKRQEMRQRLGLGESLVIGHVGRFHYAKNHEYLLEVFHVLNRRLAAEGRRSVLLLLGEGEGQQAIRERCRALGLEADVWFLGNRKEVWEYYQAMDMFVFPSRFEGLPGTVIEAQAAGLPCLVSDRVTRECGVSSLVRFLDIDQKPEVWAEQILTERSGFSGDRTEGLTAVRKAGFDVRQQARNMERFYLTGELQALAGAGDGTGGAG